jgi:hypothetical protein
MPVLFIIRGLDVRERWWIFMVEMYPLIAWRRFPLLRTLLLNVKLDAITNNDFHKISRFC